ncbi:MAG: tripartite tricarboxylate transporter substrate binding protein BugD [Bradyrhizobiaceae bacterium]|nr:tripartite tricarboxylate transporter substrate binding protein BugD [Bradyrhizobiaceae bacterium]
MPNMLRIIAGILLAFLTLNAPAHAEYPDRSITLVVPFAAGGPTDVVARIVSDRMSRVLGQTIVIQNIGGAGGTLGMTHVAEAQPDGYTIGVGNLGTQSAAPALYPNLKYDPIQSFEQIGIINFTPQAIVAKKGIPANNLQEFLVYLRANSAKLSYGHAGVGSIAHVSGLVFNSKFDLHPTLVPYKGTGPALQDLVSGRIDYMIDQSLNVIPQIKAGTIRVYAVAAVDRLSSLPDVPTAKEAGVDFVFNAWNGMVAPKSTPAETLAKLVSALNSALDDAAVRARFAELGSAIPQGAERGPSSLQKLVEAEVARITPVIKAAGVTAE